MSQIYRFKFSGEQFSVELESTDPVFIDQKLRELINLSIQQQENGPRLLAAGPTAYQSASPEATEEAEAAFEPTPDETSSAQETVAEEKPAPTRRRGRPKGKTTKKTKSKRGRKPGTKNKTESKTTQAKAVVNKEIEDIEEVIDPKEIYQLTKSSKNYRKVKKNILDRSNQLNRIMLAFYYAQKTYPGRGFSSGTMEEVTNHYGKIIRRSNIAAQIKSNPSLFSSDQEPRRGITVKYKLTAEGTSKIEEVIGNQ